MKFTYVGRLAGRNKEISANRSHWAAGAKVKADNEEVLRWAIRVAQMQGDIEPIKKPVEVYIEWHDAPRHRDVDNIQSSTKYILDALKETGILPDDNQKWVKQVWQKVIPDADDYVIVELSYEGYSIERKHNGNTNKP